MLVLSRLRGVLPTAVAACGVLSKSAVCALGTIKKQVSTLGDNKASLWPWDAKAAGSLPAQPWHEGWLRDQVGAANGHPKLRPQLHKGDSSPHQGAGTIPQLSLQGSPKAASISWALWRAWGQTLSTQRYLAAKEHLVTIYRVLMSNLVHMVTSDIARR